VNAVVFLGPSVPLSIAREIVEADFRPPAQMGDVYTAAQGRPTAIAIIDGFFESRPAVWHKEILFALSQGIRVLGGASMGALRAAELHQFGMEGVGRIFKDLASGALEDDDEVAVVHAAAESGFRSISVAMVNLRYGLERAAENGVIGETSRAALEGAAKAAFYPDRSWRYVYERGEALGIPAREVAALRAFVEAERPDQKRDDALAVLAALRDDAPAAAREDADAFTFEPTFFWDHLCSMWQRVEASGTQAGTPIAAEHVRNHVRLVDSGRERVRRLALLLVLVAEVARRSEVASPDGRRAFERFRRDRRLLSKDTLGSWLTAQHTSSEDAIELARLEALVRLIEQRYGDRIDAMLPAALRLENRYGQIVERVGSKWSALQARGIDVPGLADTDLSLEELLAWYQARVGPVQTDIETHAAELGFEWPRPFVDELVAEYLSAPPSTE
jgi:hypothetical protein